MQSKFFDKSITLHENDSSSEVSVIFRCSKTLRFCGSFWKMLTRNSGASCWQAQNHWNFHTSLTSRKFNSSVSVLVTTADSQDRTLWALPTNSDLNIFHLTFLFFFWWLDNLTYTTIQNWKPIKSDILFNLPPYATKKYILIFYWFSQIFSFGLSIPCGGLAMGSKGLSSFSSIIHVVAQLAVRHVRIAFSVSVGTIANLFLNSCHHVMSLFLLWIVQITRVVGREHHFGTGIAYGTIHSGFPVF